ncbi:MAG: substrate-binding domain-containing protein [Microcella sp.]|uniref:sugar ABC transporter substrate-binding protein n=1 Tax=Microcella sp. TaxID=1913979 RepID=UPI00331509EF
MIHAQRRGRAALALVAASSLAVLAGCATDGDGADPGDGTDPVNVAIVVHYSGPAPEDNKRGGLAAGEQLGANVQTASPQNFDATEQIQLFNDALVAGAEGIAVVPYPEDVWQKTINDTIDDGVLVAGFNVDALTTNIPLYVGVNENDFGQALGEVTLELLGGPDAEGEIVVGSCAPGVGVLERRVEGVQDYMAANAPGIEVLGQFSTAGDPTASFAAWQDLRTKYPAAVALVGVCAGDGPSIARVQANEGAGSFVGVTSDTGPDIYEAFREGTIQAAVSQSPWLQGYLPVRAIIESLQNDAPLPEGWIDSGIYTWTADNFEEDAACNVDTAAQSACYIPVGDSIFDDLDNYIRPMTDVLE